MHYASRIGRIERAAETLRPLLPLLKLTDFMPALAHGADTPTLQRIGFVMQTLGCASLADALHARLPYTLRPVPPNVGAKMSSGRPAPVDPRRTAIINASVPAPT